jgi:hypothetical protein
MNAARIASALRFAIAFLGGFAVACGWLTQEQVDLARDGRGRRRRGDRGRGLRHLDPAPSRHRRSPKSAHASTADPPAREGGGLQMAQSRANGERTPDPLRSFDLCLPKVRMG